VLGVTACRPASPRRTYACGRDGPAAALRGLAFVSRRPRSIARRSSSPTRSRSARGQDATPEAAPSRIIRRSCKRCGRPYGSVSALLFAGDALTLRVPEAAPPSRLLRSSILPARLRSPGHAQFCRAAADDRICRPWPSRYEAHRRSPALPIFVGDHAHAAPRRNRRTAGEPSPWCEVRP
jgi:hypothetical protein